MHAGLLHSERPRFVFLCSGGEGVGSVLGACIKSGDEIEIVCEGPDEEAALSEMVQLVEDGLGE